MHPRSFDLRHHSKTFAGWPLELQLELPREADASEWLFSPRPAKSHGIEDLRMVRFVDDDGSSDLLRHLHAFDGYRVLPQLIETRLPQGSACIRSTACLRATKAWHFSRGGSVGTM
jgi:hypothetical protein